MSVERTIRSAMKKRNMSDDARLQALLDQWKEINSLINKLDTETWVVFTILGSLYGIIIKSFNGDLTFSSTTDAQFWMIIILPLATAAIIGSLANNFRWVAIARMYSTFLEKEINKLIGKDYYCWNQYIIDDFLGKHNRNNSRTMPIISTLFFAVLYLYLVICMYQSTFLLLFKHLYGIGILLLFVICAIPFAGNKAVRKAEIGLDENGKYTLKQPHER